MVFPTTRMFLVVLPSWFVSQTAIPDENVPLVVLLIRSILLLSRTVNPASCELITVKLTTRMYEIAKVLRKSSLRRCIDFYDL